MQRLPLARYSADEPIPMDAQQRPALREFLARVDLPLGDRVVRLATVDMFPALINCGSTFATHRFPQRPKRVAAAT
ncbi:hypothetical protein [Rhizobium leguminosarum]|jgi:hypothetical protein|uniref:hypothetical protein n=1 Tax=Rhizobium leguminosarum TaxID=384 RepID=UPI0013EE9ABE|nr:hypothetical protein [Rhizobium leguminosarum]MBA9031245.1 hypothetical protein [Rhizobium leguminosarum]MDI5924242.1 hypothetical protein [Rhizobium leguminosarum]